MVAPDVSFLRDHDAKGLIPMENLGAIFFDGWQGLLQTAILAPLVYFAVVAAIRLSGKRTTGQMNNFDWIVTVAIGSIMASGIVIERVTLSEALLAIFMLIGLQWALTKLVRRNRHLSRAVKSRPRILIEDGALREEALAKERVTEDEVHAALREAGIPSVRWVRWMALENDGNFSVITRGDAAGLAAGGEDDVMAELRRH